MTIEYDKKTDAILAAISATDAHGGLDRGDFLRLAMACLDQGELSGEDQDKVALIIIDAGLATRVDPLMAFVADCAADCAEGRR